MANKFPEATGRLRDPRSDPDYYQRLKETVDALPDNLTDQEADAILQEHGTSAKEVVNGFIEQLLRERLALQGAAEAAEVLIIILKKRLERGASGLTPGGEDSGNEAHVDSVIQQLRAALHPQPEEGR